MMKEQNSRASMMHYYTFWHGRGNSSSFDPSWLEEAETALQNNAWTSPLYIDGSGWDDESSHREEAAVRLFHSLRQNTSASSLTFQNARLCPATDESFAQAMRQNKGLKVVTIRNLTSTSSSNNNNEESIYTLQESVFSSPCLETINLAKVTLSVEACRKLSELISQENSVLHSISFNNVRFAERRGLVAVMAAIVVSRSLTSLKFNSVELCHDEIKKFLLATSMNRSLQILHLEDMNLDTVDSLDAVAKLMKRNQSIKELSLRKNGFDASALRVLVSQGLLKNHTLETLLLSRNPLGDAACPHLSQLLTKPNATLKKLCLVDTKLMEQGCHEVAKAMRYNRSLQTLSMDSNDMDAFGSAILESLQTYNNTTLTSVYDRLPARLARQSTACNTWKQVDFYLRANKANRRSMLMQSNRLEPETMPLLLQGAGNQADVVFYFLQNSSICLVHNRGVGARRSSPRQRLSGNSKLPALEKSAAKTSTWQHRPCCPPSA